MEQRSDQSHAFGAILDMRGISEAILWTNFFNLGIALYLTVLWRAGGSETRFPLRV